MARGREYKRNACDGYGMKSKIFTILAIICLVLTSSGASLYASTNAQDFLAKFEDRFSLINTLQADFVQEKELSLFNRKIVIKGVLCFDKPDIFAWHVTEPIVYSMVIDGKTIRQWDEETRKVQTLHVESNPALQTMIVRMREWFTGNFTGFLEDYDVKIESEVPAIIIFVPKKTSPAADVIERVRIIFKGDGSYLDQIEISEKGGDNTVLIFGDVVFNEPLKPGLLDVKNNL
jgi:outer membrane lipoprotein-sorting protein